MIIKILWTIIGLNTAALAAFIIYFFVETAGRNFREQELGWTMIIISICIVLILLAAIPIYFSHSTLSICVSAFFALLPLSIWLYNTAADKVSSLIPEQTFSELYYKDKTQRSIASAIEKGDVSLLKELIKGQDLNIQGNRVWDWDGLNYLQFAIRIRTAQDFTGDAEASDAMIRLLTEQGSASTRAMAEGIRDLPIEITSFLLDSGADPNTYGFTNAEPLLFSAIGASKKETDVAILLVRKGARTDTTNQYNLTPLMYAAHNSGTSENWFETWRFVRFLLEEKQVDYSYTNSDGTNFTGIIEGIKKKAQEEKVSMPADFIAVTEWLEHDQNRRK